MLQDEQATQIIDASFTLKGELQAEILKGISVESMECLNEDAQYRKKKLGLVTSLTDAKFLDIQYMFYGFSNDLIENIN